MFEIAVEKALACGLEESLKHIGERTIRVATMCSGTESPLLALELISKGMFFFSLGWRGGRGGWCLEDEGWERGR